MSSWRTFRITLDVLISADEEEDLPDAKGVEEAVKDCLATLGQALDEEFPMGVDTPRFALKSVQSTTPVPDDAPVYRCGPEDR